MVNQGVYNINETLDDLKDFITDEEKNISEISKFLEVPGKLAGTIINLLLLSNPCIQKNYDCHGRLCCKLDVKHERKIEVFHNYDKAI